MPDPTADKHLQYKVTYATAWSALSTIYILLQHIPFYCEQKGIQGSCGGIILGLMTSYHHGSYTKGSREENIERRKDKIEVRWVRVSEWC